MPSKLFREHQFIVFQFAGGRSPKPTGSDFSTFSVRHFSGQALGTQVILDSDFSTVDRLYPSVSELADSMGEWLAVGQRPNESGHDFIVFADAFGYCPIFYAKLGADKLAISDSFHGVAAAMEQANTSRSINFANYISAITGSQQQSQTIYSDQTMIEEIRVLSPDYFLHVSDAGVSFMPRSMLGNAFHGADYQASVRSGIELSSSIFSALSSIEGVDRRITLSGGVDSRTVLAMLIASGHHSQYKVFSVDPRTWHFKNSRQIVERDIELADLIRRDFGMSWWQPGDRSKVPTNFRESLWAYQSHRSNYHYTFRPMQLFTLQDQPSITLRGGGGEIISSTAVGRNVEKRFSTANTDDSFRWLAQHFIKDTNTIPELRDLVKDHLLNVHQQYAEADLRRSIDNHYFHARNRAHFGHMAYSRTINEIAVHLLSNPFFLQASKLMNFESKAEGALIRDIFKQSTPDLLEYVFDKEEWTSKLGRTERPLKDATSGAWTVDYDTSMKTLGAVKYAEGHAPAKSGRQVIADSARAAKNYLKWAFALVEELVPESDKGVLHRQHALILSRIAAGHVNSFQTVAKVASVLDGFFPQPALGAKIVRYSSTDSDSASTGVENIALNFPSARLYPKSTVPVFEHHPVLAESDTGFVIESNLRAEVGTDFRFAYYLLKDGERVANRWYTKEPRVVFEGPFGPGVYQAISHVRYRDERKPTFFEKTGDLRIE